MRQCGRNLIKAFLILLAIRGLSFAQQAGLAEPNIPVTLDDYLYQAAMNNSGLRAAF